MTLIILILLLDPLKKYHPMKNDTLKKVLIELHDFFLIGQHYFIFTWINKIQVNVQWVEEFNRLMSILNL